MFYLIQENIFRQENEQKILETLEKLGLEYETVDCLPFVDDLKYQTERKDVFCFGSVKMAHIATKENFVPGSYFGGNHDFEIYSKHYGKHLLNHDSVVQHYTDPINFVEYTGSAHQPWKEICKFIRPTKDSKLFTGRVFSQMKWEDLVKDQLTPYLNQEFVNPNNFNGMVQVSTPKVIWKEARVWIVDGKVVTSSYYRFDNSIAYEEYVAPEGLEFAQEMANLYQVADAFVMDICFTPDGWKIVEINCINCSGFYKGDLQKIVIALENKYS